MTDVQFRKRLFSTKYLEKWCEQEEKSNCDTREVVDGLMTWLAKLSFLIWLPRIPGNNFGTLIASHVNDYAGDGAKEGFESFLEAVFGQQEPNYYFHISEDIDLKYHGYGKDGEAVWSHPSNMMQNFVPYPPWTRKMAYQDLTKIYPGLPLNESAFIPRNISGLSKLLLYPAFVRASTEANGISIPDVIKGDVERFPYTRQANFIVRKKKTNHNFLNTHLLSCRTLHLIIFCLLVMLIGFSFFRCPLTLVCVRFSMGCLLQSCTK